MPDYIYFLVDPAEGKRLCGGDYPLYLRLVRRLREDGSFNSLGAALKAANARHAYLSAHSLKGLAAQLALPALEHHAATLCDLLRVPGPETPHAAAGEYALLAQCYSETLDAIDRL